MSLQNSDGYNVTLSCKTVTLQVRESIFDSAHDVSDNGPIFVFGDEECLWRFPQPFFKKGIGIVFGKSRPVYRYHGWKVFDQTFADAILADPPEENILQTAEFRPAWEKVLPFL